jgi:hypothetical protein
LLAIQGIIVAGLSGYIIGGAIALVVAVVGGTIVQLIKRLYIDEIKDTQSAAQNLTAFFIFVFTSVALGVLFYLPFGVVLATGLGLTFGVATARYWLILNCYGGSGASAEKQSIFGTFKARLEQGGLGVKRYEQYLGLALDRVDRFFRDDDPAVKTLWPTAFGFRGNKPFWTAPAYGRCVWISFFYPLLALTIIWVFGGSVGPAEKALGLAEGLELYQRFLFLLSLVFILFIKKVFIIFALVVDRTYGRYKKTMIGGAIGGIVGATIGYAISINILITMAIIIGNYIVPYAIKKTLDEEYQFIALVGYNIGSTISLYALAYFFGEFETWLFQGPLLLFGVLISLINAPFDWLSIGLTRALLRRGVEAGGFAPVWLALLDLVVATLLIILLAAAMVFAVDLFEVVGRSKIIDVANVLDALADPTQRLEPQYWWIYATLFSTLIPSLLNVALAALSFMRGIIPFHRRVADRMLVGGEAVGTSWWMAPALGLEVVGAAMIGLYLTYLWIFKAVPLLFQPFEWLIPMLRAVAGWV